MCAYQISGGRPLAGRLKMQGAKNSVLPILAATVLAPGESVIDNCPNLSDVDATLEILRLLGCKIERDQSTVRVDASELGRAWIPDHLMGGMRSSVVFLGSLLSRCGGVEMSYPGGCALGPRPINLHLSALRSLGACVQEEGGRLFCNGQEHMAGRDLYLPLPSVGATENAILAACGCPGKTTIVGAAREPEIVDLQKFLRKMGAEVSGAGESIIAVEGGRSLHGAEHTIMGDRMAAATYLCAVGSAGGCVCLEGIDPSTLTAVLSALRQAGTDIQTEQDTITITCAEPLSAIDPIRTAPYPGFPTDAQAPLMAALCGGTGTTMIVENIFSGRYRHVDELRRMGAEIQVDGHVAVVSGRRLHGAEVFGSDLRGTAALVVAALGARGVSRVHGEAYIQRGYENFVAALQKLGADIRMI